MAKNVNKIAQKGRFVLLSLSSMTRKLAKKVAAGISTRLLNHLIGLDQHVMWYHKTKLLGGL